MFQPEVLKPEPEKWLVRAIREVDPALRVVWGMERYFLDRWVIERKISPERYFRMYRSILESGEDRFVEQPIFDSDQPIFDDFGNKVGSKIVGYRKFDLAPEHECVMVVENCDGSFRPLDSRTLVAIRRTYAEDRFHSLNAERLRRDAEQAQREASAASRRADAAMDGVKEAYRELGKRVQI